MAILKKGQEIGVAVHHSVYKPAKNLVELKTQATLFNGWHKAKSWAEATKTPSAYPYISYHYLMATNGDMLKVTDEKYVKYHSGDSFRGVDSFNEHGIAVCLTGNYENDKPTDAQMKALVLFIRDVEKRYKINARVRGHKETSQSATACPGKNIGTSKSGWLKLVIANVNNKNYPPVAPPPPPPPPKPPVAQPTCEAERKQIEALQLQIKALNEKVATREKAIVEKNDTINAQKAQLAMKDSEYNKLVKEIEGLRDEIFLIRKNYDEQIKDLKELIEKKDKQIEELKNKVGMELENITFKDMIIRIGMWFGIGQRQE
jgi:hypothetical protein